MAVACAGSAGSPGVRGASMAWPWTEGEGSALLAMEEKRGREGGQCCFCCQQSSRTCQGGAMGHLAVIWTVSAAPPAWLWHGQESHGTAHLPVLRPPPPLRSRAVGWCPQVPPLDLHILLQWCSSP